MSKLGMMRGALAGRRSSELIPRARLRGPMPWVIAIMIALTAIATAGGLALSNMADNARAEIANGATVQIVEASATARERQAEAALAAARGLSAVASATRVSDAELQALIEPWLGDVQASDEAIPVPALIDVRFTGEADEARVELLRSALTPVAPSARVDAQSGWLGPVFDAVSSLQWLAIGLVILLATISASAVWLAARSSLGYNRDTIEIVHLLGGTDSQIARVFQRSIMIDAIIGGIVGLVLGAIAIVLLGSRFSALGSGMVEAGGLGLVDWLIIVSLPIAGALIAMLTARFTVLSAVRRML